MWKIYTSRSLGQAMTFEEILARDGILVYKTRGRSMKPMLRNNRDLVVIAPPSGRLKKYDIALYKRNGQYVLHRVIAVRQDHYLIRGDNTFVLEKVSDAAVIGILTGFQRNGTIYAADNPHYLRYVRLWNLLYPLRFAVNGCRKFAVAAAKKAGFLPALKRLLRHGQNE